MQQKILDFISSFPVDVRYDNMTKAFSKKVFHAFGEYLIQEKIPFALFFIDFDTFKKVNDNLGHSVGDQALIDCVRMLKSCILDIGFLFRNGGDEFAIITPNVQDRQRVWDIAHMYSEYVRNNHFSYLKSVFPQGTMTLTSGIVLYPFDGIDMESLLSLADKALYRGKQKGKNCYIIYDRQMHANITVSNKQNNIRPSDMVQSIFKAFQKENDSILALKDLCQSFGKIYANSLIAYQDDRQSHILFHDEAEKEFSFIPLTEEEINLPNEDKKMVYKRNIMNDISQSSLLRKMELMHIRTFLAYKLVSPEKKDGYFIIMARRDKVWSEEERGFYLTATLLFSTLNLK